MNDIKITWNDVKNGNPKGSRWVLVTYQESYVTEAYWNAKQKKYITRDNVILGTVTAWADMPTPYKEE